jgi:hypothetical protein
MVDGRLVDFDVTFGDWTRLCAWLGQQSDDPILDAFASLCFPNVDVALTDATAAIAAARALAPPEEFDLVINTIEHNLLDTDSHFSADDLDLEDDPEDRDAVEPPNDPGS